MRSHEGAPQSQGAPEIQPNSSENEIPRATVVIEEDAFKDFVEKKFADIGIAETNLKAGNIIVIGNGKGRMVKAKIVSEIKPGMKTAKVEFVSEEKSI